jgi:hypothetical protein
MSILGILKAGVPQGSVLGPLLFLLFINDIANDIQSLVRLFADDSSLIFSSTNPLEVEDRLNLDLQVLDNWAKQWLVDFNELWDGCCLRDADMLEQLIIFEPL